MIWAIFAIAFTALTVLNLLLVLTAFTNTIMLWPVPKDGRWQSYVFWPLLRIGLGLTILLGLWQFAATSGYGLESVLGVPLAMAGFGFTIFGYFDLGIENTYGADGGLVTSGFYQYSRNPQYVASIAGFAGLSFADATVEVAILCTLAIAVYVLLPFTEEPWLAEAYGERYEAYKAETPRFLSLAKLADRLVPAER